MSRPSPRQSGTVGRPVIASTNAFELKWSSRLGSHVHHYDVILPLWETKNEFKLGARKGTEIIMRLQEQVAPSTFTPAGAYDGKKNLFSFAPYSFKAEEFRVPWDIGQSNRSKFVSVKVVFVRVVNLELLRKLLLGDRHSLAPEGDASITLNMLNVFVHAAPKMQHPRINNAKSFFTPTDKRSSDKMRPLELWRGYFQSVRPSFNKVIVNVDVTVGVVVPPSSLERICGDFLNLRDIRQLSDLRPAEFQKLRLFLKGLKVEINLAGHQGKRPKTIKDIAKDVGNEFFDKGGVRTSVADHFKDTHNHHIRPKTLGVRIGHDGLFPISVCKTIQQLYKHRSSPEVIREALDFSPANPLRRIDAIRAGWQHLQYNQSQFLLGAGISVNPEPLQVNGRVLPTPEIGFGGKQKIALQRPGVWDVMRKTLVTPANLERWTVVDFAGCEASTLNMFVSDLTQAMMERGMNVKAAHSISRRDGNIDVAKELFERGREAAAQMILVILPDPAAALYRAVKRFGDISFGVTTQCVKWSGKLSNDAKYRKCNQYHNNLILKINVKLGGVNYVPRGVAMQYLAEVPTMMLGADVSHPGPGSSLPSISALVASLDPHACIYSASIRVQEARTEIIEDLTNMLKAALQTFHNKNNVLPRRLFIFRDGVSEGEFATVLDKELSAMKVAIKDAYGGVEKEWPQLTFIIVGKRHHFRFFPMNAQSSDDRGNGNLHAGFVVDRDIVHPVHPDFYLQSQPGLKGTSRPSHYTILKNDAKLPPDGLQELAYALCHCYSRSTRSVKIPAPVYYADLVCRRAKFHFDDEINFSDDMSAHSDEKAHVDHYKEHFTKINDLLKDKMYFV